MLPVSEVVNISRQFRVVLCCVKPVEIVDTRSLEQQSEVVQEDTRPPSSIIPHSLSVSRKIKITVRISR